MPHEYFNHTPQTIAVEICRLLGDTEVVVMNSMRRQSLGLRASRPLAIALTVAADAARVASTAASRAGKHLKRARVFLNGVLLALMVVFYVQHQFVEAQIQYVVESVTTADMTMEDKALALLHEANTIVSFGLRNASSSAPVSIQRLPSRGFDESVLLPTQYCGDAANILLQLLDNAGIEPRLAQMRCGASKACHILVEANIYGRWVVLDPVYGIAFRNRSDQLATYREVSEDWEYFRAQTPAGYDPRYKYDGVRYTNWDKIPILMPLLQRVLVAVLGEDRTSVLSLRTYLVATYKLYLFGCLAGLLLLNSIGFTYKANRGRPLSALPGHEVHRATSRLGGHGRRRRVWARQTVSPGDLLSFHGEPGAEDPGRLRSG